MNINHNLLILLLMSSLVGCASLSGAKQTKVDELAKTDEIIKQRNENVQKASDRLKEVVLAAKKSGKDKVNFLAGDMYLKASAALLEGDYYTANLIFKHLIELVPEDIYIQKKYAISLIRAGNLEDSKIILEKVFAQSKDKDEKVGLILAGIYSSLDKPKESLALYKKLLKNNPKNYDACIFLAKTYSSQNKSDEAINLLSNCEKQDPKNGVFSYYIGKIYIDKNELINAKKYFQKSYQKDSSLSQSILAIGLIEEENKKLKSAIKVYASHLKKYPNDQLILSRIVQLLFIEEEFKQVIPYAERLSDLEPDNLNLKVKLGIIYTDNGDSEKAIVTFKELLNQSPGNDKILYYLGAIYQELKDFEKAIEYYGKVTNESALYDDCSIQVAQMLSALGQRDYSLFKEQKGYHKKFLEYIDVKLKETTKLKVEFSVIKAGYFENLELYPSSIKTLEKVKDNKDFSEGHKYYLASLYEKEKDFVSSTKLIMDILEKDPKNAHAWNFLGYSLIERGEQLPKAHEYIVKALTISPNDGYIRDSLGWYYFKVGETKKALIELQFAIKAVPKDFSIQKHLAVVYTHMNNFKEAKKWVVKALESVENENDKKELFEVLKQLDSRRVPASFGLDVLNVK